MLRMLNKKAFVRRAGLLVAALGLAACSNVGEPAVAAHSAHAQAALTRLAQVVTQDNFARLGFTDLGDVSQAELDSPVSVYMVRLDQLRDWQSGSDPHALLIDLDTAFYPVRARGVVRSSIEMHRENGAWEAHSYGNSAHAQIVDRVRAQAAQAAGVPASALFEVRVLALNAYFLGHESARGLMLTPMLDDAALGLKAGEPRPASEVFALLRPLALRHDGQPT